MRAVSIHGPAKTIASVSSSFEQAYIVSDLARTFEDSSARVRGRPRDANLFKTRDDELEVLARVLPPLDVELRRVRDAVLDGRDSEDRARVERAVLDPRRGLAQASRVLQQLDEPDNVRRGVQTLVRADVGRVWRVPTEEGSVKSDMHLPKGKVMSFPSLVRLWRDHGSRNSRDGRHRRERAREGAELFSDRNRKREGEKAERGT